MVLVLHQGSNGKLVAAAFGVRSPSIHDSNNVTARSATTAREYNRKGHNTVELAATTVIAD